MVLDFSLHPHCLPLTSDLSSHKPNFRFSPSEPFLSVNGNYICRVVLAKTWESFLPLSYPTSMNLGSALGIYLETATSTTLEQTPVSSCLQHSSNLLIALPASTLPRFWLFSKLPQRTPVTLCVRSHSPAPSPLYFAGGVNPLSLMVPGYCPPSSPFFSSTFTLPQPHRLPSPTC